MKTAATTVDPATLGFVLSFFKLNVTDIDRMSRFYERAFGFVVDNTIRVPQFEERMLKLPGQDFTLVLMAWADVADINIGNGHGPIGFHTNDADATADQIANCGGTIETGPISFPGVRAVIARDPEGHEIEIICLTAPE